jgi:hypothetical protein
LCRSGPSPCRAKCRLAPAPVRRLKKMASPTRLGVDYQPAFEGIWVSARRAA